MFNLPRSMTAGATRTSSIGYIMMVSAIIAAEQRSKMKAGVLLSAMVLILIGHLLAVAAPHTIMTVAAVLFVYFLGLRRVRERGGDRVYNTTQSIGLAQDDVVGGWLVKTSGQDAVFFACSGRAFRGLMIVDNIETRGTKSAT